MAEPFPHVIGPDGKPRYLAALPPRNDFGGLMKFSAANPIIARKDWRDVDMSPLLGDVWDQGQHGSCVGHGSTKAFEVAYRMAGGTIPPSGFSPTSLYALINGGRDGGAVVSDSMDALIQQGVCTMAECPESVIYKRQIPASANETRKRFRASDAYHTDTVDAMGTALQLHYPVSFGIAIRSPWNSPGSDGMIATGGVVIGGHCTLLYGMYKLPNGNWAFRGRNSWGIRYGKNGNFALVEWHFDHGGPLDAFAMRCAQTDPMDPNPAPVAH